MRHSGYVPDRCHSTLILSLENPARSDYTDNEKALVKVSMNKNIEATLQQFDALMRDKTSSLLGYPINTSKDYRTLYRFFDYSLINLGDPFVPSSYRINAEQFEIEALRFIAGLYRMPAADVWGYLASGCTESNLYGIFLGRELYPDARLYFSQDTHYSLSKIARLLRLPTTVIRSQTNGEMDYADLETQLRQHLDQAVIINCNLGTTMKGAVDQVERIVAVLKRLNIKRYHLHCDAALFGMMLPFLKGAPKADFTLPIGSLAISAHKFIGTHIPCGITLARKRLVKKIETPIEYIGTVDTTITGCRNGHTPLFLWYAIKTRGRTGFAREANGCVARAQYLAQRLKQIGWDHFINPFSNIVLLKKPAPSICKKWQLAISHDWAHVVVMQSVTKKRIDEFISDLHN
ncbi:histidine decarboxylase [Patescibacteria group bacterium]|nr:histidine decarboxylase [Patescibacteria group bacterium]MCL5091953.1 histidine decarboxylase [Patescibacteria group bacterium]